MKSVLFSLFLTAVALTSVQAEDQLLAYPTADDASFVITIPEDWELKQAESEGDYFDLTGPTGAVFSFRTIKGSKASLEKAIDESVEGAAETFNDLKFGDPEDWTPNGLTGLYMTGSGKDKEDGTVNNIGMGWCFLEDGKIAEFWFAAHSTDKAGIAAAEKIANSLKAP